MVCTMRGQCIASGLVALALNSLSGLRWECGRVRSGAAEFSCPDESVSVVDSAW
jgi:hypothetical protein